MKFVALALALLLAVGSQAASLMADAPSELSHIRAVLDTYMDSAKESARKALAALDDPEYNDLKLRLSGSLDNIHVQIKTLQGNVSPITDSVVSTLADATADLRASIQSDLDTLERQTLAQRENLKLVIKKHLEEYRTMLEPIVQEYQTSNKQAMDALRVRLEPVMAELNKRIAVNVEETKTALMPIVEEVGKKVNENIQKVKDLVTPYVEDYKEQLSDAYNQARQFTFDDLSNLKEQIAPHVEEIKEKLNLIFQVLASSVMKN